MKTLLALAFLSLLAAGCTYSSGTRSATLRLASPYGTDPDPSNPSVNEPMVTTTTTQSASPPQ